LCPQKGNTPLEEAVVRVRFREGEKSATDHDARGGGILLRRHTPVQNPGCEAGLCVEREERDSWHPFVKKDNKVIGYVMTHREERFV
jgi:hypothetical protein